MIVRKSSERGHANHGWLDSYHSFSFGRYIDRNWMGYSALRVINEDVIAPGQGFGMHSHDNMEIITVILQGELAHKDSLGNVETIKQGQVQRMTAGTGITHSEFNASDTDPVHLLQIWITPNQLGLAPGYEDGFFSDAQKHNQWCLLASEKASNGALKIHQDMQLFSCKLSERNQLQFALIEGRTAYLQVASGSIEIASKQLNAGDAAMFDAAMFDAAMFDATELIQITAHKDAEILLFDLP